MTVETYRQGDVLLIRIDAVPGGLRRRIGQRGRLVLARGKATGRHHTVAEHGAELLEAASPAVVFLKVMSAPALLTHEDHAPVEIPPGSYRVVRQREFA